MKEERSRRAFVVVCLSSKKRTRALAHSGLFLVFLTSYSLTSIVTMKFSLLAVLAATCAAPAAAEIYLKEQFNDDVSQLMSVASSVVEISRVTDFPPTFLAEKCKIRVHFSTGLYASCFSER
jgi:hypothetical protein